MSIEIPAGSPKSYFQVRALLDEGIIPNDLSATRIQVFDYLLTHVLYKPAKGQAYGWVTDEHCTLEWLSRRLGLSQKTVDRSLIELESRDLIERRYREHGQHGKGNPKRIYIPWLAGYLGQQDIASSTADGMSDASDSSQLDNEGDTESSWTQSPVGQDTESSSPDTESSSVRARSMLEEVKEPKAKNAGATPGDALQQKEGSGEGEGRSVAGVGTTARPEDTDRPKKTKGDTVQRPTTARPADSRPAEGRKIVRRRGTAAQPQDVQRLMAVRPSADEADRLVQEVVHVWYPLWDGKLTMEQVADEVNRSMRGARFRTDTDRIAWCRRELAKYGVEDGLLDELTADNRRARVA